MLEIIIEQLQKNLSRVQGTLADFSDADMLVRPVPGANHALWQLGHITLSERHLIKFIKPELLPALPENFEQQFSKENVSKDNPADFPLKSVVLDLFIKTREATITIAKACTPKDLAKAMPEPVNRYMPTVAHSLIMTPSHVSLHIGQMQVIRRKLGKPILF